MTLNLRNLASLFTIAMLAACRGGGGGGGGRPPAPPPPSAYATGPTACTLGTAADFRCSGISLRKRVPFPTLGGSAGNDIWGWYDSESGKEYALVGMTTGTAFVDITNPESPIALGTLPTATFASGWRDIKVYKDHAYVVADNAGGHGMQVFDLTHLRDVSSPQTFTADVRYTGIGDAHNIAINEATGFAYIVGSNTCNGGLHMLDLSSPASPVFAGCHSLSDTHDTQCVTYHGPDTEHQNREICFSSNADHVEIVDVTEKSAPLSLATLVYPDVGYVHQGWLSEDHAFFFVGDELDELNFGIPTRTIVLDVADLDAPFHAFSYDSSNTSTDHNLYVRGNRIYEGNYSSGLRVLDIDNVSGGTISEIAFFDTYPQSDESGFDGVWSVYPYLPSGTVVVNDRMNGLFLLTMDIPTAFATTSVETAFEGGSVMLEGTVAGSPASVSWVQTGGPTATVVSPGELSTSVTLPDVLSPQWLSFDLVAVPARAIDTVYIQVLPLPAISSAPLNDPALQQCVDDLAAANSYTHVGSITSLNCAGISDVAGIEAFPNLRELVLAGTSLANLTQLADLPSLELLDLSGFTSLACDSLDTLENALDPAILFSSGMTCRASAVIDLGATGFDSAIDAVRRQLYVSLPERQEILVASLDTTQVIDRIFTPGAPYGIDLSLDGTRLFAALRDTDSVLEISLDTGTQRTISLNGQASHSATYDVVEAQTDRLFVTANPGSSGFARVVQVLLDQGDAVSQVADQRIIRARPALAVSPDRQFLYVGEGFSPNSLYRLSLSDPLAGIILEDQHGSVSGTDRLALDATGTRIALRSGQVLRTGSFIQEGSIPPGTPTVSAAGDRFAVNATGNNIRFFDALTLEAAGVETVECDLAGAASLLHAFDDDRGFALIYEDALCLSVDIERGAIVDSYPQLHFTDLALEACVRATAVAQGWSEPGDFLSLDCSASTEPIRSLEGLDTFVNLVDVDISQSEVLALDPLSSLEHLSSIAARGTDIANLGLLLSRPSLTALDVTGSPNVSCEVLDGLKANGVTVDADECVGFLAAELGGIGFDVEIDATTSHAFVSVPALNSILEIDLGTFSVVRSLVTTGAPQGIDISEDGLTLYAALGGLGSIAYIDIATGTEQVVDLIAELGDENTYDVAEISADRILVSASPGSGGFAYIVEVRRDLGDAAQQVADGRIIRAGPEFAVAPDGSAVFVREGFSPPSIYKLGATQADLPIVAEDEHGSLIDTQHLQISPDGALLIMRSGQLVDTATIGVVGRLPTGWSTFSADGTSVLVEAPYFSGVDVYDLALRRRTGQRHWGCDVAAPQKLRARMDGSPLVLFADLLCGIETVPY